jgi:hypothetical protein
MKNLLFSFQKPFPFLLQNLLITTRWVTATSLLKYLFYEKYLLYYNATTNIKLINILALIEQNYLIKNQIQYSFLIS